MWSSFEEKKRTIICMYTPRPKVIGHLVREKIHAYEGIFLISYKDVVVVIFIVTTTI